MRLHVELGTEVEEKKEHGDHFVGGPEFLFLIIFQDGQCFSGDKTLVVCRILELHA